MPVKLLEQPGPTSSASASAQSSGGGASRRSGSELIQESEHASVAPASMIDRIPVKLVLMLASPYLAGETSEEAIELAHKIYREEKFTSTLDILGEDMVSPQDCDASVEAYKNLVDVIISHPLPVDTREKQMTISFKPSMFATRAPKENGATDGEHDNAFERIKKVVDYASRLGVNVTLEAEDHRWTDFHLDTYLALIESGYGNVGTVLQSRLFRTADDIVKFDERMRVRLVIGIYNEPAAIAHTSKSVMKDMLVSFARSLLERGAYVEIATHDLDCLKNFFANVVLPLKIPATRFETQYLHGVPRDDFQKGLITGSYFKRENFKEARHNQDHLSALASDGVVVRKYLPFGEGNVAGAYCRRRLKENPNMLGYGIKNFLKLQ